MNAYLIPGMMGLMTGLVLHWGRLSHAQGLRSALGLRRSLTLRTALTALGWGILLTALLMWLAVVDVDQVDVLPLTLGTLLGGALFGICAGLCGYTPTTAFAGLGSNNALEALSVIAGCFAATALSPSLERLLSPLHAPWVDTTLFKVTLDEPYLFSGAFLGLGCLGALLAVWGICTPSPRAVIIPDKAIAQHAAEASRPSEEEAVPAPDSAATETVVAALEGEEPLIVDTALDEQEDAQEDEPAEETAEDAGESSDKPDVSEDDDPD